MSRIRGLELLYNLVKGQLKSKEDCLIAALHCLFINENLTCVGIGEEFSERDAQTATELLPQQWNDNQEIYTLRYRSKDMKKRYLVKIIKAGRILHINIVLNEDVTGAMSANTDKHVADTYSEYMDTYVELDSLIENFKREIVDKVISPVQGDVNKSTDSKQQPQNPGPTAMPRVPRQPLVDYEDPSGGQVYPNVGPFPQIGGQDLDPFGRGHGGMLLDPSDFGVPLRPNVPPFMPRGAVPPGARFDPFGPPGGPNRFRPNPDNLRRPDDMDEFM